MKDKDKLKLAVHIATKEDKQYTPCLTLDATVMYERVRENGTTEWLWAGSLELEQYDSLALHTYVYADSKQGDYPSYSLRYCQVYAVDAQDAKRMHTTLSRLEKAWETLRNNEGYPRTLGQAVNQFARIIGASQIVANCTDEERRCSGERFRFHGLGDGVALVDRIVYDYRKAQQPETPVSA